VLRAESAHANSVLCGSNVSDEPYHDLDVGTLVRLEGGSRRSAWKSAQEQRRSCRTIVTAALPLRISLTLDQGDATVVAFVVGSVRRTI